MIYLLHFARPYKGRRHYMGQTEDLAGRLHVHRKGWGSRLLAAVAAAGISWSVVRTWRGRAHDRDHERKLKNRRQLSDFCPRCSGPHAWKRG